jgi:hypothetical protein
MWRDETPSPALSEFVRLTAASAGRQPGVNRALAQVA